MTGTQAIALVSNGANSGLANTTLTTQNVVVNGAVYNYANAAYSGTTLAFGNVHQGGSVSSQSVAIGNKTVSNANYQDSLNVSATTGNSLVTTTGFNSLAASTNGATTNSLAVAVNTGTLGSLSSTVALNLVSNANGVAGLSNGTATVVGSPGAITTTGQVYSGESTWATNGGGSWGTLSGAGGNAFGLNWGVNQGSPGLDASFTNTDTATFGSAVTGGTAAIYLNGAAPSLRSMTFDNANASYQIYPSNGSGPITLINSATTPATVTVSAGSHGIHTDVTLGSSVTVDVATGADFTFHTVIGGASSSDLTKTGLGTLYLVGNNTYGGNTNITQGTLSLLAGSTPLGSGTTTVFSGATLNLNNLSIASPINVLTGGTIANSGTGTTLDVSTYVVFTDTTSGNIAVTSGGFGNFQSIVDKATININTGGTGAFSNASTEYATINVNSGGQATVGGSSAGTFSVAGNATFTGQLSGALAVANGGVVTFSGSNTSGSSFDVNTGGTATVTSSGTIGGGFHVAGVATINGLVVGGSTGADVRIENGGQLTLGNTAVFGQSNLSNSGSLIIDRADDLLLATSIAGTGSLTKLGDGTLTLTGASDYTGLTTVLKGALTVDGSLFGSGTVAVGGGVVDQVSRGASSNAALYGSGTVGHVVTYDHALISAGSGPDQTGRLDVASLQVVGSTTLSFDILGTTASTDYDTIVGSGSLDYGAPGAAHLLFNFGQIGSPFANGTHFELLSFNGYDNSANLTSDSFTTVGSLYGNLQFAADGDGVFSAWAENGQELKFYADSGLLVIVPEPSSIALAGLGVGIVGWRAWQRRRRTAARKAAAQPVAV